MAYLRRHCYDKPHRCPGWAGGGWQYSEVTRCSGGSLDIYNRPGREGISWRDHWRFSRCSHCDIRAIPFITRWLDPTWLVWIIRWRASDVRYWQRLRRARRNGERRDD